MINNKVSIRFQKSKSFAADFDDFGEGSATQKNYMGLEKVPDYSPQI